MRKKQAIWIIFALLTGTAILWWTTVKNRVVKQAVTNTVTKKTDSLYKIHYDTATIDEVGGNVVIHHLSVELDSVQWLRLVEKDSMPTITFSLKVDKLTIKGLKELKLLTGHSLDVNAVILDHPVLRLEQWKRKKPAATNDTLELYQRLTGNFNFLRAKNIEINGGDLSWFGYQQHDSLAVRSIHVSINNFLVDSDHNYRNVIAYFVQQANMSAASLQSPQLRTGQLAYNSQQHIISIADLSTGRGKEVPFAANLISLTGFSADSFVNIGMFYTRKLEVLSPVVLVKPSSGGASQLPGLFSSAAIDSLVIKQGRATISSQTGKPISIEGVNVLVKNIKTTGGSIHLENYMNLSGCSFTIGSVSIPTELHLTTITGISYPSGGDKVTITKTEMKPSITREQLKSKIGKQHDLYNITARNIVLERMDLKQLFHDTVSVLRASGQVDLHVFDDKSLPANEEKKNRDKFPYEPMMTSKTVIDIRDVYVDHSRIAYEEGTSTSSRTGTVFFSDVTGHMSNITNIRAKLSKDNVLKIGARARLMGGPKVNTDWLIKMNDPEANFRISGAVEPFELSILNQPFEPMGMASFRSGSAEKLQFSIIGSHAGSTGNVVFNYHSLKVDFLRKDNDDSLRKKELKTLLANVDIRNSNHVPNGKDYQFKREKYRSFFYLVWRSVFEGARNNVLIVK